MNPNRFSASTSAAGASATCKLLLSAGLAGIALAAGATRAGAQDWSVLPDPAWCDEPMWSGRSVCEVREITLPAREGLEVDGGRNGGIAVRSWDEAGIRIQVKISVRGESRDWATEALAGVTVDTGDRLRANLPAGVKEEDVSVSYRISVPRRMNLDLRTYNGGVSIREIEGKIDFLAYNGGVELEGCAGSVHGSTRNGGLRVELTGSSWQGDELSVETTNGGIQLLIPEDYSARLITGTTNGGLDVDYPLDEPTGRQRQIRTTLGSGGPLVRVVTQNGGVKIDES